MPPSSSRLNDQNTAPRPPLRWPFAVTQKGLAMMLVLGAAMAVTQPWFAFLDDETSIVTAAGRPARETILLFAQGEGQHEHPPLSDILLHYWLPVAGSRPWLLRLPSILFFVAGLATLAAVASRLAGPSAASALLWIGVLWPFGFHFGRLVGWYSLAFFLVALMTWAYFRCLDQWSSRRWKVFFIAALALVYTNYFGWALIGCLAVDLARRVRSGLAVCWRYPLVTLLGLGAAYLPLGRALAWHATHASHLQLALLSKLLYAGYNFYAWFVSESVAPWFWALSLPAGVAIVCCVLLTVTMTSKEARYLMVYSVLLFGAMALLGALYTRRLLLISPWLLLPVACAVGNRRRPKLRMLLVWSMTLVAAAGWWGIVSRRHYAAPHFLEPWPQVADDAAGLIGQGATVVTNSPSFRFYLKYSLHAIEPPSSAEARRFTPGWTQHPQVFGVEEWNRAAHPAGRLVLLVRGVNSNLVDETAKAQSWLSKNCDLQHEDRLVPDTGYSLKNRFFAGLDQTAFRISVQRFRCSL